MPADAPTISAAVARVAANGLVLVSPGTYHESVKITRAGVTIRGTDRARVVLDGGGIADVGIAASADGIRVENLTVTGYTFYGVLITGMPGGGDGRGSSYQELDPAEFPPVQRFRVDHVTAYDNGLYGVYAFDSQHGVITDSYASGSADSGFYVGQCRQCDILVTRNVAERNAVGFENANASDSVWIEGNRWSGNRVGMTLTSDHQEAFIPQHANVVAGNLISANQSADSPAQADGGYGTGLGIAGGQSNLVTANRITGNARAGVLLDNGADIPSVDNSFVSNTMSGNGIDVADVSAAATPSSGTCLSGGRARTLPIALARTTCPHRAAPLAGVPASALPAVQVPSGTAFLEVAAPHDQPGLPGRLGAVPAALPSFVPEPSLSGITVPSAQLLISESGTR